MTLLLASRTSGLHVGFRWSSNALASGPSSQAPEAGAFAEQERPARASLVLLLTHGAASAERSRFPGTEGMITLIVLIAACAALGYVVARPWVVAVAVGAIIAFYVGLDSGWWGNGTGDGWQL